MSGVWKFKNGVIRLVENPEAEALEGGGTGRQGSSGGRRKVLVYLPTNEVITSYPNLEQKLVVLGWERYYDDLSLLQFHKRSSIDLISLPKDFSKFKSVHMYDIVVKNRNMFQVRDMHVT
ncbi:Flowering-promoting factor 1 [Dionaea muscipula]